MLGAGELSTTRCVRDENDFGALFSPYFRILTHGEEFFLFLYLLHPLAERFFFSEKHISDLIFFLKQ